MRFLYQRGRGARRRVMHLCGYNIRTGQPTMQPLCGRRIDLRFDTTSNVPLGRPTCRHCLKALQ